jgi:hypothetical protein
MKNEVMILCKNNHSTIHIRYFVPKQLGISVFLKKVLCLVNERQTKVSKFLRVLSQVPSNEDVSA